MPRYPTLADTGGKVMVVPSVPAIAIELLAVRVFPSAIVSVALVAGAVIPTLFTDVAVAVLMFGEVPKLVRLDEVIPEFNVAPVRVPAAAVTVIEAVPSKAVPLIFLAVCNLGAETIVTTGVVVEFATVAFAFAEVTDVTVPVPDTFGAGYWIGIVVNS